MTASEKCPKCGKGVAVEHHGIRRFMCNSRLGLLSGRFDESRECLEDQLAAAVEREAATRKECLLQRRGYGGTLHEHAVCRAIKYIEAHLAPTEGGGDG